MTFFCSTSLKCQVLKSKAYFPVSAYPKGKDFSYSISATFLLTEHSLIKHLLKKTHLTESNGIICSPVFFYINVGKMKSMRKAYPQHQSFLSTLFPRNILGLLKAARETHLTPTGVLTAFSIGWTCFNEVWLD